MSSENIQVETALHLVNTPDLSSNIQVYRAAYTRTIPAHYRGNPVTHREIELNLLLVEGGQLFIPRSDRTSFRGFYEELALRDPELMQKIVSPSGAAKSAASKHLTPIKEITQKQYAGTSLPGDSECYGWEALYAEARMLGQHLQVMFQGNGLYYNRGSVFYAGNQILDYPGSVLQRLLESDRDPEFLDSIGLCADQMNRPLLFLTRSADGKMRPWLHQFLDGETYWQGMARLQAAFQAGQVQEAVSASPPFIIPGPDHLPYYLSLPEVLGQFHANDIRHYLYCPYEGAVLLSAELGRAQCLQPRQLAASVGGRTEDRVTVRCSETLGHVTPQRLAAILDEKGYAQRYSLAEIPQDSGKDPVYELSINPLEGVYSHLILFMTRSGRLGIIQTSGTRGSITGNDGPTFAQLMDILKDLNSQPLFKEDMITAAFSGSQGNDVPNIVCENISGSPGLLFALAPHLGFDQVHPPRGIVTTPRMGITTRSDET
jgi:hypothetical protein